MNSFCSVLIKDVGKDVGKDVIVYASFIPGVCIEQSPHCLCKLNGGFSSPLGPISDLF